MKKIRVLFVEIEKINSLLASKFKENRYVQKLKEINLIKYLEKN